MRTIFYYLLGEIRDQLLFYYSQDEYDLFIQFFSQLRGRLRFSYDEFVEAFNEFIVECSDAGKKVPQFFESANVFLQFLYEQNVICYKERDAQDEGSETFIRWCFRERTLSNMAPKVRVGVEYEIFYGLSKALNIGRTIKVARSWTQRQVGTIISINDEKGFGFIRGGNQHIEYYFKLSEFQQGKRHLLRVSQKVSFEFQIRYGKPRARAIMAYK
jgi:cold shock CspA family protein